MLSPEQWDELESQQRQLIDEVSVAEQAEAEAREWAATERARSESLATDLSRAEEQLRQAGRRAGQLEATLGAIAAELDLAISNYQLVLLTFDQEIREAQANLHGTVAERLCERQLQSANRPLDVSATVDHIVATETDIQAALVQLPPLLFVDMEALIDVRDSCFLQANLISPKGDGFYLVGTEIGAGVWRSDGRGGACFWARRDAQQNTIASYFGPAGGTVTIQPSDFEVQFERCGTFTTLGL